MNKQAIIEALRETDGVTRVGTRGVWITVETSSASRAGGLAESIREAGFHVLSKSNAIIFR